MPWRGEINIGIMEICDKAADDADIPKWAGEVHRLLEQERDKAYAALLPESKRMKGTVLDPMRDYDAASDEFHTLWVQGNASDNDFDSVLAVLYDWGDYQRIIVR